MDKLNPVTRLAIDTYRKLMNAEVRVEKLRMELEKYVVLIPEEDMEEYARITRELEEKKEKKLEVLHSREERRREYMEKVLMG